MMVFQDAAWMDRRSFSFSHFAPLLELFRIVKSYLPSPLQGEGFPCASLFLGMVFHKCFDITYTNRGLTGYREF